MNISELKSKLEKSIEFLQAELSKVRTGRASPALVEGVVVNAYDSKMTIKELGSINVSDAQSLVIVPWDKSLLKNIAKAINDSDLSLNAIIDSDVVRVPIPDLTEERRQEMTRLVVSKVEEVKGSVRNIRQETMKDIDNDFASKTISEDEKFNQRESVEEIVKEYNDRITEIGESKKKDVLNI